MKKGLKIGLGVGIPSVIAALALLPVIPSTARSGTVKLYSSVFYSLPFINRIGLWYAKGEGWRRLGIGNKLLYSKEK